MAKIPRSYRGLGASDFVAYDPSTPVLAPMDLVDYSGARRALDTGSKYAADRYHVERDLDAESYHDKKVNAGGLLLTQNINDVGKDGYDTFDEAAERSRSDWKAAKKNLYDEKVVENMPARRKAAFRAAMDLLDTKHEASLDKLRTESIVSDIKAGHIRDVRGLLTRVRDPNTSIDSTLDEFEKFFNDRMATAKGGGKVETTAQVQAAYVKDSKFMGEAIIDRFTSTVINKATKGLIKSDQDLGVSWNGDNSIGSYGSKFYYHSYLDLIKGIGENGDFAKYLAHTSPGAVVRKLNRDLHTALESASSGRTKVLKQRAYDIEAGFLGRDYPPTDAEIDALKRAYVNANLHFSAQTYNALASIGREPSPEDKESLTRFQNEVIGPAIDKETYGISFDVPTMMAKANKWFAEGRLHPKHYKDIMGDLRKESRGQNKDINTLVGKTIQRIQKEHKITKGKTAGTMSETERESWAILSDSLGMDIATYVRNYIRKRHAEASSLKEEFRPEEVQSEILDLITQGVNNAGLSSARLNIPLNDLERAYETRLNPSIKTTSYDDLLIGLAEARAKRWKRFLGTPSLTTKSQGPKSAVFGNDMGGGFIHSLWKYKNDPAASQRLLRESGGKLWYHQMEFSKNMYEIDALRKKYLPPAEYARYGVVTGAATGAATFQLPVQKPEPVQQPEPVPKLEPAQKPEPVPKLEPAQKPEPDKQLEPTATDGGAGLKALPEDQMPPDVRKETKERQEAIQAGEGEEVGKEYFNPRMPRLTKELLGHTADGRPIWKNETDADGWDSESSERATIIEVDGKYYSYPTLFNQKVDGKLEPYEVTEDRAKEIFIENEGIDPETGIKAKPFDDHGEAEDYMIERSEHLSDHLHGKGGQEDQDTTMQEITSLKAQGKKTEAIVVALDKISGFSDMLSQTGQDASEVGAAIVQDIKDGYETVAGMGHAMSGEIDDAVDTLLDYLERKLSGDLDDRDKVEEIENKLNKE